VSGPGELTWNEAMDRARGALIDSERLYDDINASKGRSNLDIEKHLRRSEVRAAQAQAWLMFAGELGRQGERYGHPGT
jgi:predicted transcriptional regulator